jgi:hypothetical protein
LFVTIVNDRYLLLCALEHRPSALGIAIRFEPSEKGGKQARESKVEITNTLNTEKDQQPQLSLVEFPAAKGSFRQPTAAEVSLLTFRKLRDARSHAQELSNEFARLLNRGSSLE